MKAYIKIADTKQLTHDEWLEVRKQGIGGSEAGAVLGLNPYSSAYSVYHEKLSLVAPFEGNAKTRLGTDLEEYVAKRFCEIMAERGEPKKVKRVNAVLRSVEYPFMIADVDRMLVGENVGLECKTTTNNDNYDFDAGEYPTYWYCQVQHYMAVMEAEKWYICVLDLSSGRVSIIEVKRNEGDIESLIEGERKFWEENIQNRICPAPNGSERCEDIIKEKYPQADEELPTVDLMAYEGQMSRLTKVKERISELDAEKSKIEQTLKEALGEAPRGEYGLYTVTFKNSISQRLDSKKLKAERPEIYDEYARESTTRRFLFTVKK